MANDAEDRKSSKYRSLAACYSFKSVAVETLGALGEEASAFFQDLGRRITTVTAEPRSFQFVMQRLSVTLQRSNAACILGLSGHLWDLMNFLFIGISLIYLQTYALTVKSSCKNDAIVARHFLAEVVTYITVVSQGSVDALFRRWKA